MTIRLNQRIQQLRLATPVQVSGERIVASPFQFMVTGEDNLRIKAWNSRGGVTVSVHGRMLNEQNELVAFAFAITPAATRTVQQDDFALGVGFLINVTVFASVGDPLIGECFVQLELIRGFAGATFVLGTLLQGYITADQDVAWPGSPIRSSIDGGGAIKVIIGTNPAAGVEISESVPTGARWELLALRATLTTSAVAGNREPVVNLGGSATPTGAGVVNRVIPANTAAAVVFQQGHEVTPVGSALTVMGPLPINHPLTGAHDDIITATINLDAADDWGSPTLLVREWLEAA